MSLEDLYNGFKKKLAVTRKRPGPDGRSLRDEKTVLVIDGQRGWKSGTKVTFEVGCMHLFFPVIIADI